MILLQTEAPTNDLAQIILAVGSVLGIIGGIISPFILIYLNKIAGAQHMMATKVDGLLEQKTLADKALGRIEGIDTAAKEKAIGDARELQSLKEQQLLNQPPPNRETKSEVKDVKDEIVHALEREIHKKGDEIQKVVESKGDEIHKGVDEVPDKTAEKVVEKLPPKS